MSEQYFLTDQVPHSFKANYLKPMQVKVEFFEVTVSLSHINRFHEYIKLIPPYFFMRETVNDGTASFKVRYATLNVNPEEIPPYEREVLALKVQKILRGCDPVPFSPYRIAPKGANEIMFHVTNLLY